MGETEHDSRTRLDVTGRDVAVVSGTLALWGGIVALAGRSQGLSIWATSSWGRWDTGLYLQIADSGYAFGHCDGIPNRGPSDYCGSSGWFPGYPYAMRLGSKFGPELDVVGRLISWTALIVVFAVLWFGFVRSRPRWSGLLAMGLAAAFPASVYYGAIFPVSTMIAFALLALVCIDRERWLLAGCCGAGAAIVYPSGVVLGVIALVPLTASTVGVLRDRVRAALLVAVPIATGYLLVLANFQRATGHWDAWFKTQRGYHLAATFPLEMIRRQVAHIGSDPIPAAVGIQTIVVTVIVVAAGWVVWAHRHDLTLGERGTALAVLGLWVLPLTLGGDLSLYRAESLLLPVVILLSRLRPIVLGIFVVVCVPLGYRMAQLFFDATLI